MNKSKETKNVFLPAVIIFIISIILFNFIAKPIVVNGESMEPTLKNKQWLFINKVDKNIDRFDTNYKLS